MVDYTTALTPLVLIVWVALSILLITKINSLIENHKPSKKKQRIEVNYFALLAILFFIGFLFLQNLEYTGLAIQNAITGFTPTSETPEDFSLGLAGIFIALIGVVLFIIEKQR